MHLEKIFLFRSVVFLTASRLYSVKNADKFQTEKKKVFSLGAYKKEAILLRRLFRKKICVPFGKSPDF